MSTNDTSREDWIDDDGDDCLPVFVTKHGEKYHKRDGGCIELRFADTHYDLFAAERDGYEPCHDCFHDDPYIGTTSQPIGEETTSERLDDTGTERSGGG